MTAFRVFTRASDVWSHYFQLKGVIIYQSLRSSLLASKCGPKIYLNRGEINGNDSINREVTGLGAAIAITGSVKSEKTWYTFHIEPHP